MIVFAIITAVIVGIAILRQPYIGLIVLIIGEYSRIGTLVPAFGKIRFTGVMAGLLILTLAYGLFFSRKIKVPSYEQNKAQIGFLFAMAMSVLFAYVTHTAYFRFMAHLGTLLLYFMIISLLDTQYKFKRFFWAYLSVNAFLAILGLHKYFIEGVDIDNLSTAGFIGGGDDYAVVINAAVPFAFFIFQSNKIGIAKIIAGLYTAMFIVAVVLTFSRGGWVALIGTVFLISVISRYRFRTLIIFASVAIIILANIPQRYVDEFNTISPETGTAQHRFELWTAAAEMWVDHPIVGVGLENFPTVYGRFYKPAKSYKAQWSAVHSIYFQVLAEMGTLGVIFFLTIIYWTLKDNLLIQRKLVSDNRANSFNYAVSQGLMVSILAYLMGGTFLSVLYYPPLYVIAALTVALRNIVEKEIAAEASTSSPRLKPNTHPIGAADLI